MTLQSSLYKQANYPHEQNMNNMGNMGNMNNMNNMNQTPQPGMQSFAQQNVPQPFSKVIILIIFIL